MRKRNTWFWLFNPKEYTKWYHYIWVLPIAVLYASYITIVNLIDRIIHPN